MAEKLLTISEAAEMIGVSIDTLRRWDKSGALLAIRPRAGAHRMYHLRDIEIFMTDLFSLAKRWSFSETPREPEREFYCPTSAVFQARLSRMERELERAVPALFSLLSSITGEIGNNSFDHNLGNWPDVSGIFFAYDTGKHQIILADRGQGILHTLQRVRPALTNDADALKVAFTEVITGRAPEHRGNGLKYVRQVVTKNPIRLLFQTGDAVLNLEQGEVDLPITETDQSFRGCLVLIRF